MKQKIREFFKGEFVASGQNRNWCRRTFSVVTATFLYVLVFMPIMAAFGPNEEASDAMVWAFFIGILVLFLPFFFVGFLVYERWVGPHVRRCGWNEYSYFRGVQMLFLTFLTMCAIAMTLAFVAVFLFLAVRSF